MEQINQRIRWNSVDSEELKKNSALRDELVSDTVMTYCELFKLYKELGFLSNANAYLSKAKELIDQNEPSPNNSNTDSIDSSLSTLNWDLMQATYESEVRPDKVL